MAGERPEDAASGDEPPFEPSDDERDIHDEDFQFALKALLAAYEPVLAEELDRARDPERLEKEALGNPPGCEDEFALADRIFDAFLTDEVAVRLLPPEARELLGDIERWRWCLRHIRCCVIFGWLVCRGQRTFRGFSWY